jgi:SH3-like domain-containing protein
MKILLAVCILSSNFIFSQESKIYSCKTIPFEVYLDDEDNYSNIRENPNGRIVLKINNIDSYGYILNVIDFENGWLKINEINSVDANLISEFEGWIHSSIVGVALSHNVDLLDKPNGKKVLKLEGETGETFKIKDIHCEWVKIKTKKGIGWVKSEKLCGNPVTTCP